MDLKHSIMFKKKKILNIFWYTYQRNHRKATNNKEVNMHLDFLTSQMIITCVKVKKINWLLLIRKAQFNLASYYEYLRISLSKHVLNAMINWYIFDKNVFWEKIFENMPII